MGRINKKNLVNRNAATTPVTTTGEKTSTFEGGDGWKRDAKSELFLAAITSLNEDTFYESASARTGRIANLVREVAADQDWVLGFVGWLRKDVGLRTVPLMVAAETVHYRLSEGMTGGNRELVRAAIARLDEVSEFTAYWLERFGRTIPSAVKRGLGDALNTLLNEGSFLKWSGKAARGSVSLADVINLSHAKPKDKRQAALYSAVLDRQYGNAEDLSSLPVLRARHNFLALSKEEQIAALSGEDADRWIRAARLTHEAIAGAIGTIPADVWENLIPHMGYTALRMNLRRISEAGVSLDTIDSINKVLRDTEQVARARVMPIDFLRAYRNAPLDFHAALQRGANGALDNIPALSGRTLVLLDRSGSMYDRLSSRSGITRQDAANVFAAALALRCEDMDVVAFDNESEKIKITSRDLLKVVEDDMPEPGGGTYTARAFEKYYDNHDRVIVLTDEQTSSSWFGEKSLDEALDTGLKPGATVFTWNLAGYSAAHGKTTDRRWTFGGLTDKGFQMIPLLEAGVSSGWPWEQHQ